MWFSLLTSDYHNNDGDGGSSFWPEYGCHGTYTSSAGIFSDNDRSKTERSPNVGSQY